MTTTLAVTGLTLTVAETGRVLVRDVAFDVPENAIVGLVGESGSGKSMISLSLMGVLPDAVKAVAGEIALGTAGPRHLDEDSAAAIRARSAMIFQNPRAALHPTMRIGKQLRRVLRLRRGLGKDEALAASRDFLRRVGIFDIERVERAYAHQLSGGMSQRVMIAMALATEPRLLIADEPTTGLDVTIQAQILQLVRNLAEEEGCSVLMITHDLAVVSSLTSHTVVLFGGQVMEAGETFRVFSDPRHPYTAFLLSTVGRISESVGAGEPDAGVDFTLPGCRFAVRCPLATELCRTTIPERRTIAGRTVSCHHAEEGAPDAA
jgi:oligopeptide/dipeptide ABC transporter ATP-binding protein